MSIFWTPDGANTVLLSQDVQVQPWCLARSLNFTGRPVRVMEGSEGRWVAWRRNRSSVQPMQNQAPRPSRRGVSRSRRMPFRLGKANKNQPTCSHQDLSGIQPVLRFGGFPWGTFFRRDSRALQAPRRWGAENGSAVVVAARAAEAQRWRRSRAAVGADQRLSSALSGFEQHYSHN